MAAPADVRVGAANPDSPGGSTAGVGSQFELIFWQSIATSEDPGQFEAYLQQYPNGTFSALARAKIAALARRDGGARAGVMAAAIPPAPSADAALPAADNDLVQTDYPPAAAGMVAMAPPPPSESLPMEVAHEPQAAAPPADTAPASAPCGPEIHPSAPAS